MSDTPLYKIRIFANACVTRFNSGERPLAQIVNYYVPEDNKADQKSIRAEILKRLPNVDFEAGGSN